MGAGNLFKDWKAMKKRKYLSFYLHINNCSKNTAMIHCASGLFLYPSGLPRLWHAHIQHWFSRSLIPCGLCFCQCAFCFRRIFTLKKDRKNNCEKEASAGCAAAPTVRYGGFGVLPNKQKPDDFLSRENRPVCRKGTTRHCLQQSSCVLFMYLLYSMSLCA